MDIISAIVTSNPIVISNYAIYGVENNERKYVVISKDLQSVKDAVFININQKVTIRGTILHYEKFDNVILTDMSRIVLN